VSKLSVSRRDLFRAAALGGAGALLIDGLVDQVFAADESARQPLNRFPRMVQEHFIDRVTPLLEASRAKKAALKTKADAEEYVRSVQERVRESFGPAPERTPLDAKTTRVVERDAYNIEMVIFESRPNFLVTANLYVPKGRKFPLPGVVGTCGHSTTGKTEAAYQSFAQGLARQGYVVLIFDPIGQGERLQFTDENLKSTVGVGVREHLHGGNQQYLVGENFTFWRAWDGMRALDYLLSRDEVDPKHVGVTGNSGGGTATTYLCGIEPRWTMAAPSCFVTSFQRNLENELPADTEQCPPKAIALGLDHEDFLVAMAPKPVIILAKEKDYFDVRGNEEAYERLRHVYRLLGHEENIAHFAGPTYHGYSQENREAMYRWFNRATGISDAQTEPELTIEEDATLWCTTKGQVTTLDSKPIFVFTREKSQQLARQRGDVGGAEIARAIVDVLHLPNREGVPDYRILRPLGSRDYPKPHAVTYAVETEPDLHAIVYRLYDERHYSRPPRGEKRAVLYVSHHSSDAELREEPLIAELITQESPAPLYTCDVRGIGESRPDTCGEDTFLTPYGCDYFYAAHAIMLDAPYLGQRTHDVLRVLDWLASLGHEEVHLVGKGWGALPATFAAVLHDGVTQVTLKHPLRSYAEVAEARDYHWPLALLPPHLLERFDLPDCYRALENKQLRRIDPWGAAADT
jgi:cephalosporin-C deacetylase-like acetyl esterase/pimeloyl-ACP methyl ester carboxylesterase